MLLIWNKHEILKYAVLKLKKNERAFFCCVTIITLDIRLKWNAPHNIRTIHLATCEKRKKYRELDEG